MYNLDKTIDTKEDIKAYLDATISDDSPEPLIRKVARECSVLLSAILTLNFS